MNQQDERSSIRAELDAFFSEQGIRVSQTPTRNKLSKSSLQRIRDLAWRVVQGEIDPEEIARVSKNHASELNEMVQRIISLRDSPALRELQQANPYYDVLPSKIVKDS